MLGINFQESGVGLRRAGWDELGVGGWGVVPEPQEANKLHTSGKAETYKTQNGPSPLSQSSKEQPGQKSGQPSH